MSGDLSQLGAPELCTRCGCAGADGVVFVKELTGATDFYHRPEPCERHWNKAVAATGAAGPIQSESIYGRGH